MEYSLIFAGDITLEEAERLGKMGITLEINDGKISKCYKEHEIDG